MSDAYVDGILAGHLDALCAERDALKARVAELKAQLADVKAAHEEDLRAARKHAREALNLRVEREALRGRVAELEEGNVRRQVKLEAERDEMAAALRDAPFRGRHVVDMVHDPCRCSQCLWVDRRAAVLSKYPEGR